MGRICCKLLHTGVETDRFTEAVSLGGAESTLSCHMLLLKPQSMQELGWFITFVTGSKGYR